LIQSTNESICYTEIEVFQTGHTTDLQLHIKFAAVP